MTTISEDLAAALHALVDLSVVAEASRTDPQAARRAIEQALVVVRIASRRASATRPESNRAAAGQPRRIFSIALPRASSSTSLSR